MNAKKVLFVDDEANILSSLRRLLRKEDYQLICANGGREALALLENEQVHVVISDQKMPEMRGTEFLQRVKELYPDTVRVVLSGDADVNVIVESINKDEVYRFIPKPWNDEELKAAIRQCLTYYDLVQENRSLLHRVRAQNEELLRLNEGLENTVSERTRSLLLSQSILAKLPIAVLGISEEGIVVLTNDAVGMVFPELKNVLLGVDMREILPEPMVQEVENVLNHRPAAGPTTFEMLGKKVRLRTMSLQEDEAIRGCILMLDVG